MLPLDEVKPAPKPLLAVQEFVNTYEGETGDELLGDVAIARPWLEGAGLIAKRTPVTEGDLSAAREVREALRALLVENAGGPAPGRRALRPLAALAERHGARLGIRADGRVDFEQIPPRELDEGLFGLLLIVRDAQADGSWTRLKACADDECRWAFYDRSRSRRGTWCEMATCGNRAKNRAFRARQA